MGYVLNHSRSHHSSLVYLQGGRRTCGHYMHCPEHSVSRVHPSRYRHIAMLNDYLRRINSGEYFLDLPSYDEGELSILRSELYKITVFLREQNRLLRQDRLRLAEALSDISHQFKTPLTSMSVMAELLSDDRLDSDARREFSSRLRAQISRLTWLTDTLLKLSRLDAGAVKFNTRQVPLRDLLDKACSPLAIPHHRRGRQAYIRQGVH